jgi:hypothetical protein
VALRIWCTTHSWTSATGKDAAHGIGQAGQTVAAHDEDILNSPRLDVVKNLQPETCAFGFLDPQPEHLLAAGNAHAQNRVYALLQHAFVGADGNAQAIHKDHRINPFQGPALPIGDLLLQLFGGA